MATAPSALTTYDPGQVMLQPSLGKQDRPGASSTSPYLPTSASPSLGPEAVRATGTGPFDAAYRQNLATFAGGQYARPGGYLGFNPTGTDLFGVPTGGGAAPLAGMPNSLLDYAMGGQPFSWAPAPNAAPTPTSSLQSPYIGPVAGGGGLGGGISKQQRFTL